MQLRRILPRLHQPRRRLLLQIVPPGLSRRQRQHVKIIQIRVALRPQPLQRAHGVPIPPLEKITQPEQLPRLRVRRLVLHHRFKRRDRLLVSALPEIRQPNVQPDARHLRRQLPRRLQFRQRPRPILLPHVHHAQIRVRPHVLRNFLQYLAPNLFRAGQIAPARRLFPPPVQRRDPARFLRRATGANQNRRHRQSSQYRQCIAISLSYPSIKKPRTPPPRDGGKRPRLDARLAVKGSSGI